MISRTEIKFPFTKVNRDVALSFITKHHFFNQHPPRRISSLYFDTADFECYHLGEEGIVPREKVRFRWYGFEKLNINQVTLEIKRTLEASREKYSKKFLEIDADQTTKSGSLSFHKYLIDAKILMPTVCVTFDRMYYVNHENSRVTIDSNIQYHRCVLTPDNNLAILQHFKEEFNVLEVKDETNGMSEQVLKSRSLWLRFSKYSRAMDHFLNM